MPDHAGTIWVDAEDLLTYFAATKRPSGIQRLAFELMRALLEQQGADRVRFVRRAGPRADSLLREVPWSELAACFDDRPQDPLLRAGDLQRQAARSWGEIAGVLRARQRRRAARAVPDLAGQASFAARVRPGDHLLVLGAPWIVSGFATLLAELKRRHGLIPHLLLYDLIPVRHREWCTKRATQLFESWLDASLPLFDGLMSISRHTAHDVAAYARERGLRIAGPIRPIPIGSGLPAQAGDPAPVADLPRAGTYVLFVSTLEARKNHALAVRVWRQLLDEVRTGQRAPGSVPDLVFAGRVGWLVADLLKQLDNMRWLGGRIRLLPEPSDAELRALYEGCLFTLFPSWSEGWGLPVSESLAFGKPCLASRATAVPEAGGALCRYFDPGNTREAHRAVASILDEPGALEAWQERVRREFRPTPWTATADAVLDQIEALAAPVLAAPA